MTNVATYLKKHIAVVRQYRSVMVALYFFLS